MKSLKAILLFIWLFLPTIIVLCSCTSQQIVRSSDVNYKEDGPFKKVWLVNGDSLEFQSEYGDASTVRKDTLIGIAKDGSLKKITINNIQEVLVDKPDAVKTWLLAGGLTALGIAFIVLIVLLTSKLSFSFKGGLGSGTL